MKKTILTFLLALAFAGFLLAQDQPTEKMNKGYDALAAKVLFIDYGNPNGIDGLNVTNGLEIEYLRNINQYLNIGVPLKVGVANVEDDINNRNIVSLDAILQLQYQKNENSLLIPYLMAGGGIVFEKTAGSNIQIPIGAGLNIKVGKNTFVNLQGEYRISQAENRNNLQGGIGVMFRFGKQDMDGDGVADMLDECPDVPGSPALAGCPDRDGDGVADAKDKCPDAPGRKATKGCPDKDGDGVTDDVDACPEVAGTFNGCPDTDGDGIADDKDVCPEDKGPSELDGCPDRDKDGIADRFDECPDEKGTLENLGCPENDTDGDGIADATDKCPEEAGTAATMGCPDRDGDGVADADDRCPDVAGPFTGCPDTDGDGLMDADDSCPEEAGPTTNKGCPEIKEEDKEVLEFAMRAVQFETGKATLKVESNTVLDQIVDILNQYPGYKLIIAGHTDNVGDENNNQVLSEERARSCYQYLASKGINPRRMSYVGYGESQPVAENDTPQGRTLNRRVEFDLYIE